MSTRSIIGKADETGAVMFVYCHWDGDPDGVGVTLAKHYTDPAKIDTLLAHGSISTLEAEIGDEPHSFEDRPDGITTFYGRDRGDTGIQARFVPTIEAFWQDSSYPMGAQYAYLFVNGRWQVDRRDLASVLAGE